ncbi:basic proline-rich protein-like [Dipodomys spectabilis]|uniref:basic proline-rich protein-like n=1 Tax=Dipodomys spectabilis TaxID=105255 RepID=UPI001C541D17|nr:basic proline-rich protein-like [Dipodomys spectabilis]
MRAPKHAVWEEGSPSAPGTPGPQSEAFSRETTGLSRGALAGRERGAFKSPPGMRLRDPTWARPPRARPRRPPGEAHAGARPPGPPDPGAARPSPGPPTRGRARSRAAPRSRLLNERAPLPRGVKFPPPGTVANSRSRAGPRWGAGTPGTAR